MVPRFLFVVAIANAAIAYSGTTPLVAWSSSSSSLLNSLPERLDGPGSLLEGLLAAEEVCLYDAIVIIDQPGLHASDLRRLSPESYVSTVISSSKSARQYPYLPASLSIDISALAESVSQRCGSRLLKYEPGQSDVSLTHGVKHVVCVDMQHIDGSRRQRRDVMAKHEPILGDELSTLASMFPNHLMIYTGSLLPSLMTKRQAPDTPDRPVLNLSSSDPAFAPSNTSLPTGGILKKYQLLTPVLITSLLVTFFVLLPVVFLGLNALASIQTPVRSDIGKSFNAQDKKNQ
ncbi:hypothetical protein CVT26_001691 [Gymnopilus dilepis]|uniref:Protein BIG1 n=1 Tax=Gymnopilus dilepis TaxID=231916 RepID=A0A409VRJ4_9AGAR|nr:hypothetical protein CVT26_001691 [Gymnopilus dilepis]